ncbi:endonuclease/exonuclease/phosphatase family protein [Actinomadura kijaniata]|uniref:endonuclease/exonuclease/phosphatase family protein n=1 Tax=Actinomadura kijaniata TaxID=46161 RepID=UPI003F1AE9E9
MSGDRTATATRRSRVRTVLVTVWGLWLLYALLNAALAGLWWVWLVPSSVPPVLFLAVPALAAAVAACLRTRSTAVWLSIGAGLVLGAPQSDLTVAPPSSSASRGSVRLMSWNTEYWDQNEDPRSFYGFIRGQNADIYLLQEHVHRNGHATTPIDRRADLREWFPGYHVAVQGELVTLSRDPIVASVRVSPDVLRTDIRLGTARVAVYNVHLPVHLDLARNPLSWDFWSTVRERHLRRQADLSALRASLRRERGPRLVAGDFNSSSATGDIDWLRQSMRDAAGTGYPRSWPQGGDLPPLWRLDWCFVAGGLSADRYELRTAPSSDHRPQIVDLSAGRHG